MATPHSNPIILIQNQHHRILDQPKERLELYRALLQRRFDLAATDVTRLKIPRLRGLRLRLPGKPFHVSPELFFQEGGRTHFELPHETVTANPGDAVLIPARMPHQERWSGNRFLNLILVFYSEGFCLTLGYVEHGKGSLRCGPVDRFHTTERFAVLQYLEQIAEVQTEDAVSNRLRQGLYLALLARIIQGLSPSRQPPSPKNDRIVRCREMIEAYACKMDFSVAWLARELGCTPDHISRRFRTSTGYRIMEAVHGRRVDQARHLLHDSDMNIAEIAWACGYTQPSYFNRIFKTLTSTTPKAFRRGASYNPRHQNGE